MFFEPESLAVRPPFGPQPLEQVMHGGDTDHGLTRLRRVFVVLAQAPVASLPRIGPLHNPTHRQWLELRLPFRAAHDLQPVEPSVAGQPVVQLVIVVLRVCLIIWKNHWFFCCDKRNSLRITATKPMENLILANY